MITDSNIIRATVADIKNKHLAVLQEKEQRENEETDQLHIRYGLARCCLNCLKQRLKVVYENSDQLSKLSLQVSHRHYGDNPDGIYHYDNNILGTHHHYIDFRHFIGLGAVGTIRIYTSCEPNLRVFYGVDIHDQGGSKYLKGILQELCRSVGGEKLSLVTNQNDIVMSHANVIGRLLAESEL